MSEEKMHLEQIVQNLIADGCLHNSQQLSLFLSEQFKDLPNSYNLKLKRINVMKGAFNSNSLKDLVHVTSDSDEYNDSIWNTFTKSFTMISTALVTPKVVCNILGRETAVIEKINVMMSAFENEQVFSLDKTVKQANDDCGSYIDYVAFGAIKLEFKLQERNDQA